jgi:hypothetical protein
MYHQLIKLMHKFESERDTLALLALLLSEASTISIPGESLKEYIGQLKRCVGNPHEHIDYIMLILDSLLRMIRTTGPKDVFMLTGEHKSGIGVVARKGLHKEGYGFFGLIRIERKDQARRKDHTQPMCLYKLGTSKGKELELTIKEGVLEYSV